MCIRDSHCNGYWLPLLLINKKRQHGGVKRKPDKSFNGKGAEDWTVYCDDNNNDKLDEGEDFVEFNTKYDYDKAEEGTRKVLSL